MVKAKYVGEQDQDPAFSTYKVGYSHSCTSPQSVLRHIHLASTKASKCESFEGGCPTPCRRGKLVDKR
jgi:hypothetical protein